MLSNNRISYTKLDYTFSKRFKGVKDSYTDIQLPFISAESSKKILIVLDYLPTDDLKTRRLLKGTTADLLDTLESLAKSHYGNKYKIKNFNWLACTFNAFRTAGTPKDFQQAAKEEFAERISCLITKYKPDTVIIFGDTATRFILPDSIRMSEGKVGCWHGVPITATIKYQNKSHTTTLIPNISLNSIVTGSSSQASMLGYIGRRFANGLHGSNPYAIDEKRVAAHRSVLIDTIPKFNKMLDMLQQQPVVAIDTETANLNKVTNTLLTIQFAKCVDFGYFVPIYHKDTPFTSKELLFIKNRLKSFFEGQNKNKYHVYTNAVFDLNVIRTALSCRYMYNDVWDIFAGEYAHDENYKFLDSVTGDYYYSLGNIAVQYGYTGYLTDEFGKKHRAGIAKADLSKPLIRYGTSDVVVPFAIHEKQIEFAEDIGHTKYKSLVMEQISDIIHGFSTMGKNGSKLDVDYLFSLQAPNSPIELVIKKMETTLLQTDAVKKANKILSKNLGIPKKSLFDSSESSVFNLRTIDHKHLLFFKILKLDPLSKGKSGKGKLDKSFQKYYSDVPEVKAYTALEKAKKLKNAFVKNFIKFLGTSDDLKSDHCIRPNYHYLKVITGRTSASDPNLQQVPNHSELAKHIKRLFIAPPGYLYWKVDYRVHEVRCWGLISFDKGIAELFLAAKKLRDSYRLHPTDELKKRLESEADIHVMNAMYFFSATLEKVLANGKELRNGVKAVVFGLIYQMSVNTLANNLGKSLDFTQNLVNDFIKRFPKGMKWIETTKKFAKQNYYYENPVGFRRHVWGLALPDSLPQAKKIHGAMLRQIVNSPIQGMASQFMGIGNRQLSKAIFEEWKVSEYDLDIRICNSVHDSLENLVAYKDILRSIHVIEDALTTKVGDVMIKRHDFKFVVPLEIDLDVGASLDACKTWSGSILELESLIYKALVFQKKELHYKIDVDEIMEDIFVRQLKADTCPKWLKQQIKNINYTYNPVNFKTVNKVKRK
jgi:DNA polymerase I-like protein with 3'-5' exonuclease and polymerase domains